MDYIIYLDMRSKDTQPENIVLRGDSAEAVRLLAQGNDLTTDEVAKRAIILQEFVSKWLGHGYKFLIESLDGEELMYVDFMTEDEESTAQVIELRPRD